MRMKCKFIWQAHVNGQDGQLTFHYNKRLVVLISSCMLFTLCF